MSRLELIYPDAAECPFNTLGADIPHAKGVDGTGVPYEFKDGHVQFIGETTNDGKKGKCILISFKHT